MRAWPKSLDPKMGQEECPCSAAADNSLPMVIYKYRTPLHKLSEFLHFSP